MKCCGASEANSSKCRDCASPEPKRRLWGLEATLCDALLGALVDAEFLFKTRDGAFMRVEHAAPVKASLRPDYAGAA